MRRWRTRLVVAGLVAVGLAAGVDAVVGGEQPAERASEPVATAPGLARQPALAVGQLREAGVTGVLTYSDEECRLHAVSLPELEPRRAPPFESCSPHVPTGGIGVLDGDVVWAGLGYGAVQVVLSREDLTQALRRDLDVPGGFRAQQAVALGGRRLAVLALAQGAPREPRLAVFEGERLRARVGGLAEDALVRPSPRARYVAVLSGDGPGVRVYTRAGRAVALPEVGMARTIAWSPDERWTALATEDGIHVFSTQRPESRLIRIPLAVRDLDWAD